MSSNVVTADLDNKSCFVGSTMEIPILFCTLVCWLSIADADILSGLGDNLFGHKCSYFWRHPNVTWNQNRLTHATNNKGEACKAIQFNYVSRHGARYPGKAEFKYFEHLQSKIVQHSNKLSQFPFLQTWQDYPSKTNAHVEDLGRWELHYLGGLYGNALYDLFDGAISPQTIRLTGTNKERTQTSSSEFYKGLTNRVTGHGLSDITPTVDDSILRYFDCPKFELAFLNNRTYMHEQFDFQNSSLYQQVLRDVSNRLGMNVVLTVDDIKMMYMICATDLAVRNNSDWCSLQTEKEREILNYESDIEDYYSFLYGHPMIPQMTCPLWVDIFNSFQTAISSYETNKTYVVGDLKFGHSDTMDTFYSSLGLFQDKEPLRADNFLEMKNRTFYESKVTTFSAHVAFVLYSCGGSGAENYYLKMIVNGDDMIIPGCDDNLCSYLKVRSLYQKYIDQCNWRETCALKPLMPAVG